jgi:hypothetical protein
MSSKIPMIPSGIEPATFRLRYVSWAGYIVCVNEIIIAFRILLSVLNVQVTVCSVTILASITCQAAGYHNIITWLVVINICITVIMTFPLLLWKSLM